MDVFSRYYCHGCNRRLETVCAEFVCALCGSGFVETLDRRTVRRRYHTIDLSELQTSNSGSSQVNSDTMEINSDPLSDTTMEINSDPLSDTTVTMVENSNSEIEIFDEPTRSCNATLKNFVAKMEKNCDEPSGSGEAIDKNFDSNLVNDCSEAAPPGSSDTILEGSSVTKKENYSDKKEGNSDAKFHSEGSSDEVAENSRGETGNCVVKESYSDALKRNLKSSTAVQPANSNSSFAVPEIPEKYRKKKRGGETNDRSGSSSQNQAHVARENTEDFPALPTSSFCSHNVRSKSTTSPQTGLLLSDDFFSVPRTSVSAGSHESIPESVLREREARGHITIFDDDEPESSSSSSTTRRRRRSHLPISRSINIGNIPTVVPTFNPGLADNSSMPIPQTSAGPPLVRSPFGGIFQSPLSRTPAIIGPWDLPGNWSLTNDSYTFGSHAPGFPFSVSTTVTATVTTTPTSSSSASSNSTSPVTTSDNTVAIYTNSSNAFNALRTRSPPVDADPFRLRSYSPLSPSPPDSPPTSDSVFPSEFNPRIRSPSPGNSSPRPNGSASPPGNTFYQYLAGRSPARLTSIPILTLDRLLNHVFADHQHLAQALIEDEPNGTAGPDNVDTIISQLLAHSDTNGPPPLSSEKIKMIPVVKIKEEQVEAKTQCSVCWESFILDEDVRKLCCGHMYHETCINPWLALHCTCPICRKVLSTADDNLRHYFRARERVANGSVESTLRHFMHTP